MSDPYDPFKDPLLLDHEADGIRELDNTLPRWWVWLFNICILFAVGYLGYYHVFHLGDLQAAQYVRENKQGEAVKAVALKSFEDALPTLTPSKDPAILDHGHAIFLRNCAPCHRADGGGLVGPNLCDDYWIHGSNFVDNLRTIVNGVPGKGMLTWRRGAQAVRNPRGGQFHLHPARHASAQSQAAGEPVPARRAQHL